MLKAIKYTTLAACAAVLALVGFSFYMFMSLDPAWPRPPDKVDAVVVLTGGKGRTDEGLVILRKGGASVLIISGVNEAAGIDSIYSRKLLSGEREKILLEKKSRTTLENAIEVRRIMAERGFTTMVLVTSEYHMKRAYYVFTMVMPPDVARIYPALSGSQAQPQVGVWLVVGEYFKYLWYRVYL